MLYYLKKRTAFKAFAKYTGSTAIYMTSRNCPKHLGVNSVISNTDFKSFFPELLLSACQHVSADCQATIGWLPGNDWPTHVGWIIKFRIIEIGYSPQTLWPLYQDFRERHNIYGKRQLRSTSKSYQRKKNYCLGLMRTLHKIQTRNNKL